jgi:hypothetical protein
MIISDDHVAIALPSTTTGTIINARVDATSTPVENYFEYEECVPAVRRSSMSLNEEKERRASIKAVLVDPTLSPSSKRRSIQHLMDGRRNSSTNGSNSKGNSVNPASSGCDTPDTESVSSITIHPRCTNIVPICNELTKRAEKMRADCPHYERNCTMIAPCCGAAFGCRICHDECTVLCVQKPKNNELIVLEPFEAVSSSNIYQLF